MSHGRSASHGVVSTTWWRPTSPRNATSPKAVHTRANEARNERAGSSRRKHRRGRPLDQLDGPQAGREHHRRRHHEPADEEDRDGRSEGHAALDQRVVMERGRGACQLGDDQDRPATGDQDRDVEVPRVCAPAQLPRPALDSRDERRAFERGHGVDLRRSRVRIRMGASWPSRTSRVVENVFDGVPEVVARHPFGQTRVVEATLVAETSVAVEHEDVEGAGRSVGPRDPLAFVDHVRERIAVLGGTLAHPEKALVRIQLRAVRVDGDDLHASRAEVALQGVHRSAYAFAVGQRFDEKIRTSASRSAKVEKP